MNPLRSLAALVGALVILACGPMLNGHSPGRDPSLVVIVTNDDVAFIETVTISWWVESTVLGSASHAMLPGKSATFILGALPDGIEIQGGAWPASSGHSWSGPDIQGAVILHVAYPSGTWSVERFP